MPERGIIAQACRYNRIPELIWSVRNARAKRIMNIQGEVATILDDVLGLDGRGHAFTRDTVLLGALPELDSMAVIGLITAMEEHFAFIVGDDEIDGTAFATLGTLVDFVQGKLQS